MSAPDSLPHPDGEPRPLDSSLPEPRPVVFSSDPEPTAEQVVLAERPHPVRPPAPLRPVVTLRDAWPGARPMRLDGALERGGFTPVWTALLVLVGAFLVYQLAGGIAMAVGLVMEATRSGDVLDPTALMASLGEHAGVLLGGNALGQAVGFGLLALFVARLHTGAWPAFLRLRRVEPVALLLAVGGWAALVLPVQWVGNLNRMLPLPQWLEEMETMQTDLIEQALMGSDLGVVFLLVTMALTPALCEELLFRGYLQRQVERRLGGIGAAVAVGIVFGLYHLRLTQFAPLALLGAYMGYVVWATGSLWAGVLVHFCNNALAVGAATWARTQPDLDVEALETMEVPWYLAAASLLVAVGACALLRRRRDARTGGAPDAAPVADPLPDAPAVPFSPFAPPDLSPHG